MSRAPRVAAALATAKRCAIYTRKSTAVGSDVSLSSLDAQRDVCTAYISTKHAEGWQALPERYDDGGYTGANLERPAFRRLLADIAAGKIDVVVVYKVDRLSRSLLDFAQVIRLFEQQGVAFVSVTQSFSTADAIGRLVLNLLMSFAEFEREMIAERTRDKIAVSRRRGQWTGGAVPFGYKVVERKLKIDPDVAPFVCRLFETYLVKRSILDVVRMLNEVAPRSTRKGTPRAWARNDVRRIIENPTYAGWMRAGDALVEGEHEALIDRDVFAKANPKSTPGERAAPSVTDFILRGLVWCGACGAALTVATTRKARTRFRYYRCVTRDRCGKEACVVRPVRAEDLETLVVEQIRVAVQAGELAPAVIGAAQDLLDERRAALAEERARLPADRAGHTQRAEDYARALEGAPAGERTAIQENLTRALADAAAVERRLVAVDVEQREIDTVALDHVWVAEVLAHFEPVWKALSLTERARMVELLVGRVVVHPSREVDIEWRALAG